MAIRKDLLEMALPFPADRVEGLDLIYHDHWLGLAAIAQKGKIVSLKQALSRYRQHQGNVIGAKVKGANWKKLFSEAFELRKMAKKATAKTD